MKRALSGNMPKKKSIRNHKISPFHFTQDHSVSYLLLLLPKKSTAQLNLHSASSLSHIKPFQTPPTQPHQPAATHPNPEPIHLAASQQRNLWLRLGRRSAAAPVVKKWWRHWYWCCRAGSLRRTETLSLPGRSGRRFRAGALRSGMLFPLMRMQGRKFQIQDR
jgi:hypothetical protein